MTQIEYDQKMSDLQNEKILMHSDYDSQIAEVEIEINKVENEILRLNIEKNNLITQKRTISRERYSKEREFAERKKALGREYHPYYEEEHKDAV